MKERYRSCVNSAQLAKDSRGIELEGRHYRRRQKERKKSPPESVSLKQEQVNICDTPGIAALVAL